MGTHYEGSQSEVSALDAFIKLMRASETLNARLNADLSRAELTPSQFGALEVLHHLGPLCQKDIAHKLLKSGGNITLVVDNLEKRGLVERRRDGADRRFVTVHLTGEGQDVIAQVFPDHLQRIVRVMAALSEDEQRQLAALCKKLGMANATS